MLVLLVKTQKLINLGRKIFRHLSSLYPCRSVLAQATMSCPLCQTTHNLSKCLLGSYLLTPSGPRGRLEEHVPVGKALAALLEARPGNAAVRHKLRDYCDVGPDALTLLLRKDCCKVWRGVASRHMCCPLFLACLQRSFCPAQR